MWDNPILYKEVVEWLNPIELELENVNVQYNAEITKEDVTMQLRKIAKWKELVLDGIQWFLDQEV